MDEKFRRIPKDVLLPLAAEMRRRLRSDPTRWTDSEIDEIRCRLPVPYNSFPCYAVRNHCENLRKNGDLQRVNKTKNVGKTAWPRPPEEYLRYLQSPHWVDFSRQVRQFWGNRCALCYSDGRLDVHHRTYERIGAEVLTDCIALCRRCHQQAERMRARANRQDAADMLIK